MLRLLIIFVFLVTMAASLAQAQETAKTHVAYKVVPVEQMEVALLSYHRDFGAWPTNMGDLQLYAEATGLPLDRSKFSKITLEPKTRDTVLVVYSVKESDSNENEYALSIVNVRPEQVPQTAATRMSLKKLDSSTLVKRTQLSLAKLDYNSGSADGTMGKRTRQAIRQFQQDHGLTVDGIPSTALLGILEALSQSPDATQMVKRSPPDPLIMKNVQQGLTQRGYDPGPVDGMMGGRTRQAIEQFLWDQQLTLHGKPSNAVKTGGRLPHPPTFPSELISVRNQLGSKLWPNHTPRP